MKRFINRLIQMVITLIGVSFLTFCLTYLSPGDPAAMVLEASDTIVSQEVLEQTREEMGLNKPFLVQYGNWVWGVLHCDMGMSYSGKKPVVDKLMEGFLDFNRERVSKASDIIVFAVPEKITEEHLQKVLDKEIADGRYAKKDVIEGLDAGRRHFVGLHSHTVSDTLAWETAQAYIALGFVLFAAAGMGIDSTALEGVDYDKLDDILGLRARGLRSVVAVSLGYRAADDSNAARPKSRLSKEDLFEEFR